MIKENSRKSIKAPFISWGVFLLFSFLFFGMWEWMQTPFYSEPSKTINQIVWDRLHCTGGDMIILILSIFGGSVLLRKNLFQFKLVKKDYIFISILSLIYTAFSEYMNVYIHQSWAYSSLMPLTPLIQIGIVPITQWMILPPLILYFVKNYLKNGGEKNE